MPKLFSTNLEKKALKLCCEDTKAGTLFFSKMDESFFAREVTQKAFKHLRKVIRKTGEVPSYNDLIEDPALDDTIRNQLKTFSARVPKKLSKANLIFDRLDEFRKMRVAFTTCRDVMDSLKKSSVETSTIFAKFTKAIEQSQSAKGLPSITMGDKDEQPLLNLTRKILRNRSDSVIPTGFKTFDKKNRGFFRGSLVTISANSGAGKSTLAGQIAYNAAKKGYKVAVTSLEMTMEEEFTRQISRMTKMPMAKLINPKIMSLPEKKQVYRAVKRLNRKIKQFGGRIKVISPDRDITMDEALNSLKPYGYDLIIIDYISLLAGMNSDDQVKKLAEGTRIAKNFARQNNCVVIILAQLKDDGNVKYAGAIRENSNNLWAFYRDEKSKESHILRVIQQKARNQQDFPFDLLERFDIMTIEDLPDDYVPPKPKEEETKKVPKRKFVI